MRLLVQLLLIVAIGVAGSHLISLLGSWMGVPDYVRGLAAGMILVVAAWAAVKRLAGR